MSETVYIPIKRLKENGSPTCWVAGEAICPLLHKDMARDFCTANDVDTPITDDQYTPHANCPVWAKDAIRLEALPVVDCESVS